MGKRLSGSAKKQIINIAVLIVLVGITLIILFLSNRELDFKSIASFVRKSNPWLIAVAFVCMVGSIVFEGFSLHVICRTLGHKCKLRSSLVYSTADIYYSAITPSATGGQPASAYYMVQDGMSGGAATFALVFNLVAYTGAIIIIGIAAFAIQPFMFKDFGLIAKILVLLGICLQVLLTAFFIACMFCYNAVSKCGNAFITLFKKMHIIKKEEKWRAKLDGAISRYKGCLSIIKGHRALFAIVLLFNLLQRVCQVLMSCFVCLAANPNVSVLDTFAMQAFVTLGYNSVPLPGGVGAFEYLYLNIYGLRFEKSFILAAMMVTRVISYYIRMAVSGVITLAYHGSMIRRKNVEPPSDSVNADISTQEVNSDSVQPIESGIYEYETQQCDTELPQNEVEQPQNEVEPSSSDGEQNSENNSDDSENSKAEGSEEQEVTKDNENKITREVR